MKSLLGVLLLLLAPIAAAQPRPLLPLTMNGQVVAPGATANRVTLLVAGGRPGVAVTFDAECVERVRSEAPGYPCMTALAGEALTVVSDANGRVLSPLYRADAVEGVSWVMASVEVDARFTQLPIYFRVGAATPEPVQIVNGHDQTVQTNFPAQNLIGRIVDSRGRGVIGVPISFDSACFTDPVARTGPLPCLLPAVTPGRPESDSQGSVDSGIRVANNLAGTYNVRLAIAGGGGVDYKVTNVLPRRSITVTTTTGETIFLRMVGPDSTCSITFIEPVGDAHVPPRPHMLAVPHGLIGVRISNCAPGAKASFSLQHPGGLPEGARIWSARPQWQPLASTNTIEGFWDFSLTDGGEGDTDGQADGKIEGLFAVGFGDPAAPNYQDLWWVGEVENGWGISMIQHGDRLFVIVFAYDAAGQPTWYVMPGGSWNATRTTYSGMLYSPRGRPINEHLASHLVAGQPVGSLALIFDDMVNARAVLNIGTRETIKVIKRQFFGVRDASVTGRYGDMWWAGPSRSGWGLVLQQQHASMFAVLFTYATDGKPTWFAMPSIIRTQNNVFEGVAYRTTSSTWPVGYDPNALVSAQYGFFRMQFTNDTTASFSFTSEGRTDNFTLSRQPF